MTGTRRCRFSLNAATAFSPTIAAGMAEGCKRFGEPDWMVIGKADYVAAYRQFLTSFSDYRLDILNVMTRGRTVVFEMIDAADAGRRLKHAIGAGECAEQPDQVDDVVAHRALLRARQELLTRPG